MSPLPCFPASYLRYTTKLASTVRIQIDALCKVESPGSGGRADSFYLITPCRAELMYLKDQIFHHPNYEFGGIWTQDEHLILRKYWVTLRQNRQFGRNPELFESTELRISTYAESRKLTTTEEVVAAMRTDDPLVARTEFEEPSAGARITLEYPIKTINATKGGDCFQVDTGPLPVPDFGMNEKTTLQSMQLAYIGYNSFNRAELILRSTFPTTDAAGQECHRTTDYREVRRLDVRNSLYLCR